ncbi:hypothetical protein HPP05_25205 [Corallococcus exiguus]|uniref:hypothetical protein n=1 Tax=Corallococcus exiguus TaxID=83462 RepID=UPI0014949ABF|nr:hypothetical protein [Corallococcus exiguus]NPC73051.1 hypothetical protein [Corallococcus exiguus]
MQRLKWFVSAIALLALACGEVSESSTPVIREGEGLLELPLVSTSAGRSYKLVGATFAITGPQNATITDTSADSVSLALMAGDYSIQMTGEWHVERTDAPGVTVPVTLVSPNPLSFTLGEGETRPVRFLFKVPGDATADVGISVDSGGWISGTFQFMSVPPDSSDVGIFRELSGKTIPFVISFETSTVTRSSDFGRREVIIETGPIAFQFGGSAKILVDRIAPTFQGRSLMLRLSRQSFGSFFEGVWLEDVSSGLALTMEFYGYDTTGIDSDGYPIVRTLSYEAGFANLRQGYGENSNGRIDAELGAGTISPQ